MSVKVSLGSSVNGIFPNGSHITKYTNCIFGTCQVENKAKLHIYIYVVKIIVSYTCIIENGRGDGRGPGFKSWINPQVCWLEGPDTLIRQTPLGSELKQPVLKFLNETDQEVTVALINPVYQEPARQHRVTNRAKQQGLSNAQGHDKDNGMGDKDFLSK